MKKAILITIASLLGLGFETGCSKSSSVNPETVQMASENPTANREESMTSHFQGRTDGVFYDVVPAEYQDQIRSSWRYADVHLFIQEDGTLNFIYEFDDVVAKNNAGGGCDKGKVMEDHPLFGSVAYCKNPGSACSVSTDNQGNTSIHWC